MPRTEPWDLVRATGVMLVGPLLLTLFRLPPFATHVILFALLVAVLHYEGSSLLAIGWSFESRRLDILVGAAFGLATYVVHGLVLQPLRELMTGQVPVFDLAIRPRGTIGLGIFIAVTALPCVEESVYRGYAWHRLRDRFSAPAAVVGSSVIFGLLHWSQGLSGVLMTSVLGLLFFACFLVRRTLLAPTVAHMIYNALSLTLV